MDTRLIEKYLSNTATADERKKVASWISQSRENLDELNHVRMLWKLSSGADHIHPDGFDKIKRSMIESAGKRKIRRRIRVLAIFSVIILLGMSAIIVTNLSDKDHEKYLQFKNASLSNVAKAIGKTYRVTIEIGPKFSNCTFTGTFSNHQSVATVLKNLAQPMEIKVEKINKRTYRLKGNGC